MSIRHLATLASLLALGALPLVAASAQERSELTLPPNGGNQKSEVTQWMGLVKATVTYHSPRVHNPPSVDRTGHVWGELVHFGFFDDGFGPSTATPWRAGANETTTLTLSHDVLIGGQPVRAGTYGLFLVVERSGEWSWILSRDASGWGSFQYNPAQDVARITATPADAPFTEFLTYSFDERRRNGATLALNWELKRVALKIDVPNVLDLYVQQIRKDLLSWPGFDTHNWQKAASFCANNRVNLDEALVWANLAITGPFRGATVGEVSFGSYQVKASVLAAMGRTATADSTMDEAFELPGNDATALFLHGSGLLARQRAERAMRVFRVNEQKHPKELFWVALGWAEGYTAAKDTARAIKQWETVLRMVPDMMQAQRPTYEASLAALRKGRG